MPRLPVGTTSQHRGRRSQLQRSGKKACRRLFPAGLSPAAHPACDLLRGGFDAILCRRHGLRAPGAEPADAAPNLVSGHGLSTAVQTSPNRRQRRWISPRDLPPRFDENAGSCRRAKKIGKPSKSGAKVICSSCEPSALMAQRSNSRPRGSPLLDEKDDAAVWRPATGRVKPRCKQKRHPGR